MMFKELLYNNECEIYWDSIFNSLEEGILLSKVIYDDSGEVLDLTILDLNDSFESIFGTSRETILGKTIEEACPDISTEWIAIHRDVATSGRTKSDIHFEINGRHFKVKIISPAKGDIITLLNDITDQVKADEVLQKHFLLFENAHDILLYLKSDGSIIDANKTAIDKYGYSYIELLSMNIQQLRHPSMRVNYKEQMEVSASKGIVFEGAHVRKDGTSFPIEVSSRSINVNGELLRIHIIRDITERKEAEEKIKYLANYDALTCIPNRGFLMRQLESTLELSERENSMFTVMLFDVDKFKVINDTYGHNAGDEVLRVVAKRLKEAVKEPDIIGRLGGDEFLIIQAKTEYREDASCLADSILKAVSKPVKLGSIELDLHISLGVSIYQEASRNIEGLIQCADTAMYAAKQVGGNSYHIYLK
jgi:diguanylate cyclase (GGDEF)-like protein/PAS domain S-box-containing protein